MISPTVDGLQARADAYKLLSVFLVLPDEAITSSVSDGSFRATVVDLADTLCVSRDQKQEILSALEGVEKEVLFDLRLDYTRLFTNPDRACVPIYEAVFKGNDDFDTSGLTFISPTALDAERCYRAWGFECDAKSNESPDHMGFECAFMGELYGACASALDSSDTDEALAIEKATGRFVETHFQKWAKDFFGLVAKHAKTGTYRSLGLLGVALVSSECKAVGAWTL